jgi:hypothetical protein
MTKSERDAEAKRRAEAKIAELLRRGVRLSKSDVRAIRSEQRHIVELEAAGTPWSPKDFVIEGVKVGRIEQRPQVGKVVSIGAGKLAS